MRVVYQNCCGLDIHKKLIVACVIVARADEAPLKEIRSFGTMTRNLLELSDWLLERKVTHVAMESTGVYWKPIHNILEGNFELLLVNAQHIKMVPGRKTDVKDCEWIADLLRHGLLKGSYVPEQPQRELRELTRYRTSLIRERSAEVNRLAKVLEGANVKLSSVASNVVGRSARQMLEALLSGSTDVEAMAQLAKGRLRDKIPLLEEALQGHFGAHQKFVVALQLVHIDSLDEIIQQLNQEVAARLRPFDDLIDRIDGIPGVGRRIAEIVLAEIGTEVSHFPTAQNLASWAGIVPGNNESAGKRHSGKIRKGNVWLRTALVEAAQAAGRMKNNYLAAQSRRLGARRGKKRAVVAVAHTILVIIYNVIKNGTWYRDLGSNYFDERERKVVERRLIKRLEGLGYEVSIKSKVAIA